MARLSPITLPMTHQSVPLQTPHSGYHWDGRTSRFFEGWYLRLTLPESGPSFAFMYSIDDPATNSPRSGGAAQILGPDHAYLCRTFPNVHAFQAAGDKFELAHCHAQNQGDYYQASATRHQGQLTNPATGQQIRWHYTISPIYGWGNPQRPQLATAGIFSFLPIFEPGWQVLMAHGLASGTLTWGEQSYHFAQAPAYAEKNWGGAFPEKWFWLQCNAFSQSPDLSLTAAGGIRQVLNRQEAVGLIGLHYQGQFYAFASRDTPMHWHIAPWGSWSMQAENAHYGISLQGTTEDPGAWVRVPTQTGLQFLCRDTTQGNLTVKLWRKSHPQNPIVVETSSLAGLEVGGRAWDDDWIGP
jgi:tocopherol cyclase